MGKIVSLREAIGEIRNGDVLFLGSLIECRRPMAAAYEIVRQRKKGLILLAECSLAEDILVGMDCAAAWRGCYTGMANFGLSPATLRKIETGEFVFELGRYRQAGTELQKALAYDIENDYGGFIKGHLGSIGSYC